MEWRENCQERFKCGPQVAGIKSGIVLGRPELNILGHDCKYWSAFLGVSPEHVMLIYGTCFTLSLNLKCPIEGVVSLFSFSYVKGVVKYKGKRETCCLTSQFWPHNKQYADVWSNIAYWDIFIRYYIYHSQKSHGLGSWNQWRKEDVTWFVNCAVARVSQKLVTGHFR